MKNEWLSERESMRGALDSCFPSSTFIREKSGVAIVKHSVLA